MHQYQTSSNKPFRPHSWNQAPSLCRCPSHPGCVLCLAQGLQGRCCHCGRGGLHACFFAKDSINVVLVDQEQVLTLEVDRSVPLRVHAHLHAQTSLNGAMSLILWLKSK